ncbi:hypothetical protein Asp14428_50530 [Actinoplanes sp. NBRC 14428]|uniref:Lipoprotein n=1 Tax=Pseudosporangium ferrugineum TaxID=439699 RepID=A0A2T0S6B3_9ACTN|nr:hypothetical protein [Pseudosporangium ferrugineum]PRY28957.1 hypothetical protein CLV70_107263 [Pseudosporangium ferrugineum]BCJ53578.1 hypothetical protein Asp14428_50530 [Actinoplanes sp. NBRC 14428]
MRSRPASRALFALAAVLLTGSAAACGDAAPAGQPSGPASAPPAPDDARVQLAARAALASDHRFAALYTFVAQGRPQRSIMATVATDGSWRVDIPGGALGGTTDVSIAETEAGVFQCAIPSATNPVAPFCIRVADRGRAVPKRYDPKIQRVFRQWLPVFTDRQAALSVSAAQPLPGSTGTCFSVDTISASLSAPVDVGIYCYADDGLLTAARLKFGTLTISGTAAAPPPSVALPGPVAGGDPLGIASPPPTTPPALTPSTEAPAIVGRPSPSA